MRAEAPGSGGRHGVGMRRDVGLVLEVGTPGFVEALDRAVVALMIEKAGAVENLEALLSVEGVDMVQFGPADYSMSIGLAGQFDHPAGQGGRGVRDRHRSADGYSPARRTRGPRWGGAVSGSGRQALLYRCRRTDPVRLADGYRWKDDGPAGAESRLVLSTEPVAIRGRSVTTDHREGAPDHWKGH